MNVGISQKTLSEAVGIVQKAIPSKPQLPVLSSMLLSIKDSKATLSATDLYIGIQVSFPVKTEDSGEIIIPGKQFKDIITSLPKGDISLSYSSGTLTVKANKLTTTLQCYVGDEYPRFPDVSGTSFSLSQETLDKITTYVVPSVSKDVSRPVLTGVFIEPSEENTAFVGTDGFRLCTVTNSDSGIKSLGKSLLIPGKILEEVSRISQKKEIKNVEAVVSQEDQQVTFIIDDVQLFSRLIDGQFPPYKQIIPSIFSTELVMEAEELLNNIKRAMIFGQDSSSIVHISVDSDSCVISAQSPSIGTFTAEINLISIKSDEPMAIAFNSQYLADFLSNVKEESIWIGLSDSLKPVMCKIVGREDVQYIVMPFRVSSAE